MIPFYEKQGLYERAYGGKQKFKAILKEMLYEKNLSYNGIARSLSSDKKSPGPVTSTTIDKWCKAYGIPAKPCKYAKYKQLGADLEHRMEK